MVTVSPDFVKVLNAMMRRDLDDWSTCWFWVLIASTAVVVFGLLAELPEVWAEILRPAWNWVRTFWNTRIKLEDFDGWEKACPELRIVAPTELSTRWKQFIAATALLGWILVAAGVAGEGVAEYFVNNAETNLRSFDQAVLIETQDSANSAAAAASLADTFSDKANANSKSAIEKSEVANLLAGKAQNKADVAGASAARSAQLVAKAEADAESAQQAALLLTAAASGHTFRPRLFNALKQAKPANVEVVWAIDDFKAEAFAKNLYKAFSDFGWQSSVGIRPDSRGTTNLGVTIFNKWVSHDPGQGWSMEPMYEVDPSFMERDLELDKRLSKVYVNRLCILALALNARLEKDASLKDEDSFRIKIGLPDRNTAK